MCARGLDGPMGSSQGVAVLMLLMLGQNKKVMLEYHACKQVIGFAVSAREILSQKRKNSEVKSGNTQKECARLGKGRTSLQIRRKT